MTALRKDYAMGQKSFIDYVGKFVDSALSFAEEVTARVIEDLEKNKETTEEFTPTPGYKPHVGDKVAIQPTSEIVVGRVSKIHSGGKYPLVVVHCEEVQEIWTVNADTVQLIEAAPRRQEPVEDVQALKDFYEERLAQAESDAQRVSAKYQGAIRRLTFALADEDLGPEEAILQATNAISTLRIIKRRLKTDKDLDAIKLIEELLREAGGNIIP